MSEIAAWARLCVHFKDTGELALLAITGRFAEFLSVPQCLGILRERPPLLFV